MGIATFIREAGERIAANARAAFQLRPGQQEQQGQKTAPASQQAPSLSPDEAAARAIADYIRALNLEIENLQVAFEGATATVRVSGTAKDQATKEKVILCCGNVSGVEKVEEDISVREASAPAQYHTVVKGDTLSAIAKKYYGDASKYPLIFEANKPMLKHPDKIYPGQSLRIPPLNQTE
jgi:nucleoid-associated protein YgaU